MKTEIDLCVPGKPPVKLKAYRVVMDDFPEFTLLTWATSAAAARYNAARGLWEAYGQRRGVWPRSRATRCPAMDASHLSRGMFRRCLDYDEAAHA